MSAEGTCPSCGGQVTFRFAHAFVAQCTFCGSSIARTDRGLKDLGKRSDVVASEAGLEPYRKGSYKGIPFTLMGRCVLGHPKGGRWSEWYAAMEDGSIGWLAEAQGVFSFSHESRAQVDRASYSYETLAPGTSLVIEGTNFAVAERSTKRIIAAEGELPYEPVFDHDEPFVDLVAPGGEVATLDFSGPNAVVYVGHRLLLTDLGMDVREGHIDAPAVRTGALACGNCGGAIKLHVPDAARRVTCGSCGSLHEVEGHQFRILETLAQSTLPILRLGRRFTKFNVSWQIVGWMERSVTSEGIRYPWSEYLAYNPSKGFAWLVESKGHWLWASGDRPFARALPCDALSSIEESGIRYHLFAHDTARVDAIAGEFPWEVSIGETVECFDYIAPPNGISCEADGGEVTWTRSEHIEPAEMAELFPGVVLPARELVGMLEPNPYRGVGKLLVRFYAATVAIFLVIAMARSSSQVFQDTFVIPASAIPTIAARLAASSTADFPAGEPTVVVTNPFELRGSRRITFRLKATPPPPLNMYVDFVGDLLNERDIVVDSFRAAAFSELDDEGSTVGSRVAVATIGHVDPGVYRLRLDMVTNASAIDNVNVLVEEGGVSFLRFLAAIAAFSAMAIPFGFLSLRFSVRRYESSDFQSDGSRSEGVSPDAEDPPGSPPSEGNDE